MPNDAVAGPEAGERDNAFDHRAFLKSLTTRPGVYRMVDASDTVIYVGKARNLKNRVASYFRGSNLSPKTRVMVSHIHHIDITVTHTEGEALLLESNLIKELRPRYNVLMRDDKSYPYIHVSSEDASPGIFLHRGARNKPGLYLGPYPSAGAVRESINLLQKMFRIRQCEDSTFANRSRPCLQYQIKRCSAPCVGYISESAYRKDIEHAILFLQGKSEQVIDELVAEMERAADKRNFEKAAVFRDQIINLRKVSERQNVSTDGGDIDVIACCSEGGQACVTVFSIRNGLNLGNRSYFPDLPDAMDAARILSAFVPQLYLHRDAPAEILLSESLPEQALIEQVLGGQAGHRVRLASRLRGQRAKWVEMARQNARTALQARMVSRSGLQQRFAALQDALQLDRAPLRLECFDISHTLGEATVASCVVFTPEGPFKSDYRRYNIRQIKAGDDYAAMRQALLRRYRAAGEGDEQALQKLPDVLFIDGGRGQLNQAVSVFGELGLQQVLLVGVAKGEGRKAGLEKLVFSDGRDDLYLTIDSTALHLIMQIRDEAHRFAISGHRAQRAKKRRVSSLEAIAGLGPKRRQTLLKHFGGLQGVTSAGVDDLARIPGISRNLAQRIYDTFHGGDDGNR